MNIENLEVGMEIKNYKILCEILEQPILNGGNAKKSQMKEFERYFEYQKVGNKFVITDIYDEPLEKNDERKLGNNSIYVKYIEAILLRHLSNESDYTCILRKKQMWLLLGMINDNYQLLKTKELQRIDTRMTSFEVNNFYQRCNQKLDRILFTALNNLKNRCLLSYYEEIVIVDTENNYTLATDNDIRRIDAVKNKALEEMKLISLQQVYCRFKSDEFYEIVNNKLRLLYNWRYTYKQYKLIYTHENIIKAMTQQEIDLQKITLNSTVIDTINTQAKNNVIKQKEKVNTEYLKMLENAEFNREDNIKIFEYPYCYLEIQKMLSEELLRIGDKRTQINNYEDFYDPELEELF
jgi:hypothetical protein